MDIQTRTAIIQLEEYLLGQTEEIRHMSTFEKIIQEEDLRTLGKIARQTKHLLWRLWRDTSINEAKSETEYYQKWKHSALLKLLDKLLTIKDFRVQLQEDPRNLDLQRHLTMQETSLRTAMRKFSKTTSFQDIRTHVQFTTK